MSAFAGMVGTLLAIFLIFDSSRFRDATIQYVGTAQYQSAPDKPLAETEKLREELKALQSDIRNVAALPKDMKLALQLQQTQKAIKSISSRQEKLEEVILANPTRALQIPLLQRDLENLRAAQQANLVAVKGDVDRIYDLNKWLLGAMAISIVTLALSNFLKGKEPKVQSTEPAAP